MRLKTLTELRCYLLALACVAGVVTAAGGATGAEERRMSLAECIAGALEHNLDIQIERYNPMIAESNRRMALGDYDPVVSMRANHDFNQDPGGIDEQARQYLGSSSDADALSGGISGSLPTGMSYSLSSFAANTYGNAPRFITIGTNTIILRDGFESSRAQFLVGELRQPLLKNFWIDGTRLAVKLRTKDLKVADYNLRQRILETVGRVETAYYDLIQARDNVKSAEIGFQLAKKEYEQNKKKVEVGTLAQLEERQAQAKMAANEAALIEAGRAVDFAQNVLKDLLADDYAKWHGVAIVPTESLSATPEVLDVQQSWNRAFQLRPDLQAMIVELERRDLITRYQRNQLFPQLDVYGSVGWQGSGTEFSDAMGQVVDGSAPRHGYGAVLSFPLSNRKARENYRIGKDERAQADLRLRQARQRIMVGVSDSIQSAQSAFERMRATREGRQFAEEALSAEEKKLANGKSTTFQVLSMQRDLTQARFEETRALADYNRALATLRQREGSALLKFNLEAPGDPVAASGKP